MHDTKGTEGGIRDSLAIEQEAADWLARQDGPNWSQADQQALNEWLQAETAHRVAWLRLQAAWQECGRLQALAAGQQPPSGPPPRSLAPPPSTARSEQMLHALAHQPRIRRPSAVRRSFPRFAAVAVLAACAVAASWGWHAQTKITTHAYATVLGEIRSQGLEDGTQATLGSDSSIVARLSRRSRAIELVRGETIFDVAKDPKRPFRVSADGYEAVAVGTRFSVRRSPDALRVVVTEGTVRLETPAHGREAPPSVLLPAGSVALVEHGNVLVRSLSVADASRLLDWTNGLLAFHDATLAEVAAEFNRYNARKLVIGDPQTAALRIGGSFRWDNAAGFVRLLEAGFPVRAQAEADRILLHAD